MRYVSVKVVAATPKRFVKLTKDLYSDNELLIEKGTICEIGKVGKTNTTLISPDEETITLKNKDVAKNIELLSLKTKSK